jgi:hypothetical protein
VRGGLHRWEIIARNGEVVHVECVCADCEALRAVTARLDVLMAEMADPVRPEWLGPELDGQGRGSAC